MTGPNAGRIADLPPDATTTASGAPAAASPIAAPIAPPVVYLLADHLDAVLAHGEDLLATAWRPVRLARCADSIAEIQRNQRRVIDDIRASEMALVARALKSRERARELAARDGRFAPIARLFAAATAPLDDAAREAGDSTEIDFDTGDGILAYVRGRGMVAADVATFDDCGSIMVTAAFRVSRRIELGPLLDLVAMFLDTLELHYDLYPEQSGNTAAGPASTATEATPPAAIDIPPTESPSAADRAVEPQGGSAEATSAKTSAA